MTKQIHVLPDSEKTGFNDKSKICLSIGNGTQASHIELTEAQAMDVIAVLTAELVRLGKSPTSPNYENTDIAQLIDVSWREACNCDACQHGDGH